MRLGTSETVALLRMRKRPANVLYGGGVGGGSLLYGRSQVRRLAGHHYAGAGGAHQPR